MKKIAVILCVIMLSSFASFQNDFSTIYFYRTRSYAEGKKSFDIYINGKKIAGIMNAGRIKYKIYSVGEAEIYAKSSDCTTASIKINILANSEYYVNVNGITCFLREFDIDKGSLAFNNPNNFDKQIAEMQEDIANPIQLKPLQNKVLTDQTNSNNANPAKINNTLNNTNDARNIPKIAKSDIDLNIPQIVKMNPKRYALIIGNEDYTTYNKGLNNEINVDFAQNDAQIFSEYCKKVLGVNDKQIKLLINATAGQMSEGLGWLTYMSQIENGEAELIFYYSGHGLPEEGTNKPFLIPVDVSGTNLKYAIPLETVYSELSKNPCKLTTIFLDACFSGGGRNQGLLAMKGVNIKPKDEMITGNTVVFASSSGAESSAVYKEQQHGFFTYFLLKKLQETKGNVSYKALSDYIKFSVQKETGSIMKKQTPQILISDKLNQSWENLIIR